MKLSDSIKFVIAEGLYHAGIITPSKRRYTDRFQILTYHRVLDCQGNEPPYFREPMFMPSDVFEAQLRYVTENANIRPLRDVLLRMEQHEAFEPSTVVLTFDDGYIDNYTVAFPLLKKYGAPATIFLTTDSIDTGTPLWWDKLHDLISFQWTVNGKDAFLASPFEKYARQSTAATPAQFANEIVDIFCNISRTAREQLWQEIEAWAQSASLPPSQNQTMTWEMIQEMAAYGIAFENHTTHHRFLDELSVEEFDAELIASRNRIREKTGQPADILAYPKGRILREEHDTFIRSHFQAATSTLTGFNTTTTDPYNLNRTDARFLLLNGQHSPAYMETELCGLWNKLRSVKQSYP